MKSTFNRDRFVSALADFSEEHSQGELARRIGKRQSLIGMYLVEKIDGKPNTRVPNADTLASIASALGVPVSEFFTDTPDEPVAV